MSKITTNKPILSSPIGKVIINNPCEINKNSIGYSLIKTIASYQSNPFYSNTLGFSSSHKIPEINFLNKKSPKLDLINNLVISGPLITNKNKLLEKISPEQYLDRLSSFSSFLEEEKVQLKKILTQHNPPLANNLSTLVLSINKQLSSILPVETSTDFEVFKTNDPLSAQVGLMLDNAEKGLPPKVPYHPEEWENAVEFVRQTYGIYLLSCGAKGDFLYQDQLREIHPDKMKVTLIKRRIKSEQEKDSPNREKISKLNSEITVLNEQYGSPEWGYDVVKALQNYYQNNKTASIKGLIKGKSDRLEQQREALRNTDTVEKAQQSASRLTYLNYTK